MAKLYIICGHGSGDPGATGSGYNEAERVRALGKKIKELGGTNVVLMDTNRNWYADAAVSSYVFPKGAIVCELHLDSASSKSAKGGHVIVKKGLKADKYDKAIAKFITGMFPGRSQSIVYRDDLANINRASRRGVNYRLVECCFISNKDDIKKFNDNLEEIAKGFIESVGLKVLSSKTNEKKETTEKKEPKKETTEKKESKKESKKPIDAIAKEVIAGKWGNGITRKNKLKAAGYDYNAVQKRVNELLK